MKVLVVGGGGREHALAWKLVREGDEIVAAPGNPGIEALGRCVPVRADDVDGLVALAEREGPDYTLVGPEGPLASGIVDRFRERGLPIFGPTQAAAQLETSKAFAKALMQEAGVPTGSATRHTDADDAKRAAAALGAPVVIKASGLAAGKGVIVAQTLDEANAAIDDMLVANRFGDAGAEVLVEEFMTGEELSLFFLTDGTRVWPLPGAQDHKRLLAHDEGPNTGGMGAYAPVTVIDYVRAAGRDGDGALDAVPPVAAAAGAMVLLTEYVLEAIVHPTLDAMRERGTPFTGLLYVGLMLTPTGPRVVEFNCRFGDPETQALMPYLEAINLPPLGPLFAAIARGDSESEHRWWFGGGMVATVTTVVAAAGYPDAPRTGDPIALPRSLPPGVHLFHAGTRRDAAGQLVTAGGRVLAVTAVAASTPAAQQQSRTVAEQVHFAGRQFRPDIGWREVARAPAPPHAGAPRD